jgi:putative ABC transport system permease protein
VIELLREVRFAARLLARQRAFAGAAIATLAVGIGSATAVFTVVNGVLVQPLPYQDADRIVHLVSHNRQAGAETRGWVMSLPYFSRLRERAASLSAIGGYDSFSNITRRRLTTVVDGAEGSARLPGTRMSPALFEMLGVQATLGRYFDAGEEEPAQNSVMVLSHRAWQTTFGGDRAVLGRSVPLDGRAYTVVGVMPPSFAFPDAQTAFWIPLTPAQLPPPAAPRSDSPNSYYTDAIFGRLAPGVSPAQAEREVDGILRAVDLELAPRFPALEDQYRQRASLVKRAEAVPMKDELVAPVRPRLQLLLGAVGLVLLIACANVANLLLARAGSRTREMAVRAAIGAGRRQLLTQMMAESLVLGLVGGALGIIAARCALQVLIPFVPDGVPRLDEVGLHAPVVLFAGLLSTTAGLAVGLVPALRVSNDALLWRGGRTPRWFSLSVVVAGEIAMATVLLTGAGLFMRSFVALVSVSPGFDANRVLTFQLVRPSGDERDPVPAYRKLLQRLEAIPSVEAAGLTDVLPIAGSGAFHLAIEDLPQPPAPGDSMTMRLVSAGYFQAMGITIVRGRSFPGEISASASPILVNREFARRYLGSGDAIGKRVGRSPLTYEVIGIVENVRQSGLDAAAPPEYYVDFNGFGLTAATQPYFAVRTRGNPAALAPTVRGIARDIDPKFGVDFNLGTMSDIVSRSVARPRFQAVIVGGFAGIAVLLAAVGIYAVMAHTVGRRTREIGTRMALGARRRDVIVMILRQSGTTTAAGIGAGLAGAAVLARSLEGMLFGVAPLDPATFVAVPLLFAAVALAAACIPARRAASVDPSVALRCD